MKRFLVPLFVSALLVLGAAACGGGGDNTSDNASSSDGSTTTMAADDGGGSGSGSSGNADAKEYCSILAKLDNSQQEAFAALPADATIQQQEEAVRKDFAKLTGTVSDLRDAAPDEIKDDVGTVADAFQRFIDGGSLNELSTDETVTAASNRLDTYKTENCPSDGSTTTSTGQ